MLRVGQIDEATGFEDEDRSWPTLWAEGSLGNRSCRPRTPPGVVWSYQMLPHNRRKLAKRAARAGAGVGAVVVFLLDLVLASVWCWCRCSAGVCWCVAGAGVVLVWCRCRCDVGTDAGVVLVV